MSNDLIALFFFPQTVLDSTVSTFEENVEALYPGVSTAQFKWWWCGCGDFLYFRFPNLIQKNQLAAFNVSLLRLCAKQASQTEFLGVIGQVEVNVLLDYVQAMLACEDDNSPDYIERYVELLKQAYTVHSQEGLFKHREYHFCMALNAEIIKRLPIQYVLCKETFVNDVIQSIKRQCEFIEKIIQHEDKKVSQTAQNTHGNKLLYGLGIFLFTISIAVLIMYLSGAAALFTPVALLSTWPFLVGLLFIVGGCLIVQSDVFYTKTKDYILIADDLLSEAIPPIQSCSLINRREEFASIYEDVPHISFIELEARNSFDYTL